MAPVQAAGAAGAMQAASHFQPAATLGSFLRRDPRNVPVFNAQHLYWERHLVPLDNGTLTEDCGSKKGGAVAEGLLASMSMRGICGAALAPAPSAPSTSKHVRQKQAPSPALSWMGLWLVGCLPALQAQGTMPTAGPPPTSLAP